MTFHPMTVASTGEITYPDVAYSVGYLRSLDHNCLIGATNDVEAVRIWLAEYDTEEYSSHTREAAIREVDRFVLWTAFWLRKPLSDIRRDDVQAYRRFMSAPDKRWVGQKRKKTDHRWRPFHGPLKLSSIKQALNILRGMFDYLVAMRYLTANPVARISRGPRRSTEKHDDKRLVDPVMWGAIMAHVNSWPLETPKQRFEYERARFILVFSYLLAPRVSDFPNHTMGDIKFRSHGKGEPKGWWWSACGKGKKEVDLPMNDDAIAAVTRWRRVLKLSDLPEPFDATPLVPRKTDYARTIGSSMIYLIVKNVMRGAAELIKDSDPTRESLLRAASPHWLRHTALSRMADVLPAQIIQRLGRHSDIKTTSTYVHVGDVTLHNAAQQHRLEWKDETEALTD